MSVGVKGEGWVKYPEDTRDGGEGLGPLDARQGDEERGDDLGVAEEKGRGVC